MFEVGDKVVYVMDYKFGTYEPNCIYKVRTIFDRNSIGEYIEVEGSNKKCYSDRFKLLSYFRKQKLEKICLAIKG